MEVLGIGPLELLFILLIALIVLGPQDMVKAGRLLGKWMRHIVTSEGWRTVQQTSRELRYLPNRLMREAGLEELQKSLPKEKEIREQMGLKTLQADMQEWQKDLSDWTTPPNTIGTPKEPPDTQVQSTEADSPPDAGNHTYEKPQESPQPTTE